MTLADELRGIRRRARRGRLVRPMGAWELYDPDPEVKREEMARIRYTIGNRRKRDQAHKQ